MPQLKAYFDTAVDHTYNTHNQKNPRLPPSFLSSLQIFSETLYSHTVSDLLFS